MHVAVLVVTILRLYQLSRTGNAPPPAIGDGGPRVAATRKPQKHLFGHLKVVFTFAAFGKDTDVHHLVVAWRVIWLPWHVI